MANPSISIVRTDLQGILSLRQEFLREINAQVRYDACHVRGWTDSYRVLIDGAPQGYGAIKGQEIVDRDTVFEFFLRASVRHLMRPSFAALLSASEATYLEAQTNDRSMNSMISEFGEGISAEAILFEVAHETGLLSAGTTFRRRREGDALFDHRDEPTGDYVLERDSVVVATGGFLTHYNRPFVDLYMEVHPDHRRRGYGAFLLQEVRRVCAEIGHVPAARCHVDNVASQATLVKAGFRTCGYMVKGRVRATES